MTPSRGLASSQICQPGRRRTAGGNPRRLPDRLGGSVARGHRLCGGVRGGRYARVACAGRRMRIKLDENLPEALLHELATLGHEVDNARLEGIAGKPDPDVWLAAQNAGRFLITQDLEWKTNARPYRRVWFRPPAEPPKTQRAPTPRRGSYSHYHTTHGIRRKERRGRLRNPESCP